MNELSLPPRQILSLQGQRDRLYGEVIQAIARRDLYWFRPLFLIEDVTSKTENIIDCRLIDLRYSSDLLLPQNWFASCFETEIIPLLAKLYSHNCFPAESVNRGYLHNFIHSLCQRNRQTEI
ncbi:hypothetical protein [Myxosarcina sp. GI1(2024)]